MEEQQFSSAVVW